MAAEDEIVVKYSADINNLTAGLRTAEKEQLALEKGAKSTSNEITKDYNKAASSVENVEKKTVTLKDTFIDLSSHLPFAGQIQSVTQFGQKIAQASNSVKGLSGTFGLLKGAIAATGIGALLFAIGSLIAYLKTSEAGGDRLARIFSVIKVATNEVVKVFSSLGETVIEFIDSGIEKFGQFADFIINGFVNSLQVVANGLKDLGLDSASEKVNKFAVTVLDASASMKAWGKNISDTGDEIANMEDALEDATIAVSNANAKLQTQLEKTLKALRNKTITYQEQIKLINKAGDTEQQIHDNNLSLINQEIAIEKKRFEANAKNQTKASFLFDEYVDGVIGAQELISELDGTNTAETVKNITDILNKREESFREQVVLEERLNNLRDQFTEQEIQRQIKSAITIADKKGNIERLAFLNREIDAKQLEQRLEDIQIKGLESQLEIAKKFGKDTTDIEKAILEARIKSNKDATDKISKNTFESTIKLLEEAGKIEQTEQLKLLRDKQITREQFDQKELEDLIDLLNQKKSIEEENGKETIDTEKQIVEAQIKLNELKNKKIEDQEKKSIEQRKAIINELINTSSQSIDMIADAISNNNKIRLQNEEKDLEDSTNNKIESLQKQKDAGIITEQQFNSAKETLDKRQQQREAELKRKQFIADQNASKTKIKINTSEAIVKTFAQYGFTPFAGIAVAGLIAEAAIQTAIINSQPIPKFGDGGEIGGRSHSQGGTLIEAEKGEFIINKNAYKSEASAVEAINNGDFKKYAYVNFVKPALDKERKRQQMREAEMLQRNTWMKAMMENGLFDSSHLERLTKSNKKVIVQNLGGLPKEIGHEFSRALNNQKYIR